MGWGVPVHRVLIQHGFRLRPHSLSFGIGTPLPSPAPQGGREASGALRYEPTTLFPAWYGVVARSASARRPTTPARTLAAVLDDDPLQHAALVDPGERQGGGHLRGLQARHDGEQARGLAAGQVDLVVVVPA
jgi:hypothetical protein